MFQRKTTILATIGLLICLAGPGVAIGRHLDDVGRALRTVKAPSFRLGSHIKDPKTIEIGDLGELLRKTAGNVGEGTVLRHPDFESYWAASRRNRLGKGFEAYEVYRANRELYRAGKDERLLITAVEGAPQHRADVVQVDSRGKVVKKFQLKRSWKDARNAINDRKYRGMTIVTDRDSLEQIRRELKKATVKADRRGLRLDKKWRNIERALEDGRLTDEMVPGFRTLTRAKLEHSAKNLTRKMYESVSPIFSRHAPMIERALVKAGRGVAKGGARLTSATVNAAARAFVVADFAFIGYQTYGDVQRYRSGILGGEILTAKAGLRGGELGIAVTLLLVPDPTTKVIAVCFVAGVVLAGADISLDAFNDAKRERTRELLERIDNEERFHATRRQLLRELAD